MLEASASEEDADACGDTAPKPKAPPSKDESQFYEFIYGKQKQGKRRPDTGGESAIARGLAREMRKERARNAHIRLIEEEEGRPKVSVLAPAPASAPMPLPCVGAPCQQPTVIQSECELHAGGGGPEGRAAL